VADAHKALFTKDNITTISSSYNVIHLHRNLFVLFCYTIVNYIFRSSVNHKLRGSRKSLGALPLKAACLEKQENTRCCWWSGSRLAACILLDQGGDTTDC